MGGFWLLGYFHFSNFTCLWLKTLLKIRYSIQISTREKGNFFLKKDEKNLEVSITISVGVF